MIRTRFPFPAWEAVALAAVLLAGLALRAAYLHEYRSDPTFASPRGDAKYHDDWARALLGENTDYLPQPNGSGVPLDAPYLRPPGYPFFLAGVYALTGGGYLAAYAVQMALGLLNAFLAHLLTRRVYGRGAALIAAALMAGYWVFIYNEAKLHAVVLLITLTLLFLMAMDVWTRRPSRFRVTGAGLLLGAMIITGPVLQSFTPVAAWWVWRTARARKCAPRALTSAAYFLLGAFLAVAPVTIRNYMVSREVVLVIPYAGMNLFIGNNPHATGSWMWEPSDSPDYVPEGLYDFPLVLKTLSEKVGHPVNYVGWSRYYAGRALDYVMTHPRDALRLTAKKALLFWGPIELPHNDVIECDRRFNPVLQRLPGGFGGVAALFLLGAVLLSAERFIGRPGAIKSLPERPAHWDMTLLLLLFTATYFATYVVFFETSQYRVPLIPALLIFGACAVQRITSAFIAHRYGRALGWTGSGAALIYLLSIPIVPLDLKDNVTAWRCLRGESFAAVGQHDKAAEEYGHLANAGSPLFGVHAGLAVALARQGKFDDAFHACEAAAQFDKTLAWVFYELSQQLVNGEPDASVPSWTPVALRRRAPPTPEELQLAVRCLERFLEIYPEQPAGLAALHQVLRLLEATRHPAEETP